MFTLNNNKKHCSSFGDYDCRRHFHYFMELSIRAAKPYENKKITEISFVAKRYWNYPEEYFEIWKNELTITEDYIVKNKVYVAEINDEVIGYYSIVRNDEDFWAGKLFVMKGYWLEHIFIKPDFIKQGIGRRLISHLIETCKELRVEKIFIFSDPNSKGFYHKIGAHYIEESPSSIEGRTVSLFELRIK